MRTERTKVADLHAPEIWKREPERVPGEIGIVPEYGRENRKEFRVKSELFRDEGNMLWSSLMCFSI